jgi:hypothetical protein
MPKIITVILRDKLDERSERQVRLQSIRVRVRVCVIAWRACVRQGALQARFTGSKSLAFEDEDEESDLGFDDEGALIRACTCED